MFHVLSAPSYFIADSFRRHFVGSRDAKIEFLKRMLWLATPVPIKVFSCWAPKDFPFRDIAVLSFHGLLGLRSVTIPSYYIGFFFF